MKAWRTYDRDAIAALFSADVAYRYHPYDDPVVGRDAVVAPWLGEDGSGDASTRDAPDTFDAAYAPVAVDAGTACFVMRFDGDGGCREFTEYFMRHP